MATHTILPYEEQQLVREHLRRGSGGALSGGSTWAPSTRVRSQAGGNTCSNRTTSAASNMDSESWEVRAFAEDASSSRQWPPRSYSCSFCQREFRTAQALGGHMNVHRRERAHANQIAQLKNAAPVVSISQFTKAQSGNDSYPTTFWGNSKFPATSDLLRGGGSTSLLNQASPSPPLQESTSSNSILITQELQGPITIENLSKSLPLQASLTSGAFHPYGRSAKQSGRLKGVNPSRFSLNCFAKAMTDRTEPLDLELRLGQSPCTV